MEKILSIIIPSYNVEKYIEQTLSSMVGDKVEEALEILVVDDGSKDKTAEIAGTYEADYPGIVKVISKENGGHGSTINTGIKAATGKYFKVVDGDDWVETDNFYEFIDYLKMTDADMVISPFYEHYEPESRRNPACVLKHEQQLCDFNEYCRDLQRIQMHGITFRTAILKEHGIRLDEHMFYVDVEYTCYPIPYINTCAFFDKPVYVYRLGNAEQSVSVANMWKRREQHKTVLLHLIDFYKQLDTTVEKKNYLRKAIAMMADGQYLIYLSDTGSKEKKAELIEFDKMLKESSREIYDSVEGRRIRTLRFTKFLGYGKMCLK